MDLEGLKSSGIFEEEDEDEERDYSVHFRPETSEEDAERERRERAEHVYRTFVEPALEELDGRFTAGEVTGEIRPPYSEEEVEAALEYGVEEEGLDYDEDEELFSSG